MYIDFNAATLYILYTRIEFMYMYRRSNMVLLPYVDYVDLEYLHKIIYYINCFRFLGFN